MRDIPVFTTAAGVGSLILKEVVYKKEAYIKIQDTCELEQFLKECCDFCYAVGAEYIYATGHAELEKYPLHTAVWRMGRSCSGLPQTDAVLIPVQKETLERWRMIHNERMTAVPNSATMTLNDAQEVLNRGAAYFVYRGNDLLGIGIAAGETVDAVISLIPGSGRDVLLALCNILTGDRINLEVASGNKRAVKLYQSLGFIRTEEISRWYKIK